MARRSARAAAVQMVYESMLGGDGGEETLRELIEFTPEGNDQAYIDSIVNGVREKAAELDEIISAHLVGWTLERISRVDLSILRAAIYELTYIKDSPESVICSEAVALANRFSTENSGRFINGVLGAFLRGENKAEAEKPAEDMPKEDAQA